MKKAGQHSIITSDQIKVLLYLALVFVVFSQKQPYQELEQELAEEYLDQAPASQSATTTLSGSTVEFPDFHKQLPFGPSGTSSQSARSTTSKFADACYHQAFKNATAHFIAIKPLLIERWQIELLSNQKHAHFTV